MLEGNCARVRDGGQEERTRHREGEREAVQTKSYWSDDSELKNCTQRKKKKKTLEMKNLESCQQNRVNAK